MIFSCFGVELVGGHCTRAHVCRRISLSCLNNDCYSIFFWTCIFRCLTQEGEWLRHSLCCPSSPACVILAILIITLFIASQIRLFSKHISPSCYSLPFGIIMGAVAYTGMVVVPGHNALHSRVCTATHGWFGLIWFVDLDSGCWWWIPISDPQPSSLKRRNLNIVCIIIILLFLFAATAALLYIFWYWTDCKNNENSRNATTITWSPLPPPRTQVGCLIMLLHDTSDVFLELAKVRDDDVCVTTYHSWWRTYDFGSSSIFISLSNCEMKNRFE